MGPSSDRTARRAASPGFSLDTYDAVVDQGTASSSSARIDELAALVEAYQNRGATTRPGGIRLHREKYFPISYIDTENGGLLCLRKRNGGACVAKSNQVYIIGTFSSGLKIPRYGGGKSRRILGPAAWPVNL